MKKEDPTPTTSLMVGEQGNQRGINIEQKVAGLISGLPMVSSVVETKKGSPEDRDMIDLVVFFDNNHGLAVDKVFVQIKASTKGVKHFKEGLTARLKKWGTPEPIDRKTWMLVNRRILLNGDIEISKSHKHSRKITDEEILNAFLRQLNEINDYAHSLFFI